MMKIRRKIIVAGIAVFLIAMIIWTAWENAAFSSHPGSGTHFYNAGDKGEEDSEDVEERLRKLQSLYDQALITREEYDQKRRDILNDL